MNNTTQGACHCWMPVMAALLIVISLSDCGLAIVLGSLADVVHDVSSQVEDRHTEMRIAGFFSTMTGGLVHLGDSQVGTAIRDISNELPPYWMMVTLAWGRVVLSVLGVLLGVLLIWRLSWLPLVLMGWGLLSVLWGLLSVFEARVIFQALVIEDLMLTGVILSGLALFLHLLWPLYVTLRTWKGKRSGDFGV